MMNAFVCALSWMCFGVGFGGLSVMGVPSVTSGRQQSHRASKGITQLLYIIFIALSSYSQGIQDTWIVHSYHPTHMIASSHFILQL